MAGNNYGATSLQRLATAHPDLQALMKKVGEKFPNTILEGERTEEHTHSRSLTMRSERT